MAGVRRVLLAPLRGVGIAQDVAACGVVGEACNVQAVYLCALSRKLDKPLITGPNLRPAKTDHLALLAKWPKAHEKRR